VYDLERPFGQSKKTTTEKENLEMAKVEERSHTRQGPNRFVDNDRLKDVSQVPQTRKGVRKAYSGMCGEERIFLKTGKGGVD